MQYLFNEHRNCIAAMTMFINEFFVKLRIAALIKKIKVKLERAHGGCLGTRSL